MTPEQRADALLASRQLNELGLRGSIIKAITAAVEAEREACAKIADLMAKENSIKYDNGNGDRTYWCFYDAALTMAKDIRARGETDAN